MDAVSTLLQYKDVRIFHHLEEEGNSVELPWNKVSTVFNFARLLEESRKTLSAILLYRLILFKASGIIKSNLFIDSVVYFSFFVFSKTCGLLFRVNL